MLSTTSSLSTSANMSFWSLRVLISLAMLIKLSTMLSISPLVRVVLSPIFSAFSKFFCSSDESSSSRRGIVSETRFKVRAFFNEVETVSSLLTTRFNISSAPTFSSAIYSSRTPFVMTLSAISKTSRISEDRYV